MTIRNWCKSWLVFDRCFNFPFATNGTIVFFTGVGIFFQGNTPRSKLRTAVYTITIARSSSLFCCYSCELACIIFQWWYLLIWWINQPLSMLDSSSIFSLFVFSTSRFTPSFWSIHNNRAHSSARENSFPSLLILCVANLFSSFYVLASAVFNSQVEI